MFIPPYWAYYSANIRIGAMITARARASAWAWWARANVSVRSKASARTR